MELLKSFYQILLLQSVMEYFGVVSLFNHGEAWVENMSGRTDIPSCCLAFPGGLCGPNYKWSVYSWWPEIFQDWRRVLTTVKPNNLSLSPPPRKRKIKKPNNNNKIIPQQSTLLGLVWQYGILQVKLKRFGRLFCCWSLYNSTWSESLVGVYKVLSSVLLRYVEFNDPLDHFTAERFSGHMSSYFPSLCNRQMVL